MGDTNLKTMSWFCVIFIVHTRSRYSHFTFGESLTCIKDSKTTFIMYSLLTSIQKNDCLRVIYLNRTIIESVLWYYRILL